jgi:hypothetical protein
MSMQNSSTPIVRFHRLIEQARMPQRADRSAAGTLPTRAYRYCEAVTTAAAFGWWIFPPSDLQFMWDGHDIFWQSTGWQDWLPLMPAAQFPNFAAQFDKVAPASLAGCSPPFLSAIPEPGVLQIWTGLMARTAPDWSLLIRAPANLPLPGGYSLYEGIVETDRWFGPLFTNLRLTRTHTPVRLRPDYPFLQVQPLPRAAYGEATLGAANTTDDMTKLTADDWADYETAIAIPNENPNRSLGGYAVAARKRVRAGCPFERAGNIADQIDINRMQPLFRPARNRKSTTRPTPRSRGHLSTDDSCHISSTASTAPRSAGSSPVISSTDRSRS